VKKHALGREKKPLGQGKKRGKRLGNDLEKLWNLSEKCISFFQKTRKNGRSGKITLKFQMKKEVLCCKSCK
jgi:hypothetical protein